jgi:hypothetical protein
MSRGLQSVLSGAGSMAHSTWTAEVCHPPPHVPPSQTGVTVSALAVLGITAAAVAATTSTNRRRSFGTSRQ